MEIPGLASEYNKLAGPQPVVKPQVRYDQARFALPMSLRRCKSERPLETGAHRAHPGPRLHRRLSCLKT